MAFLLRALCLIAVFGVAVAPQVSAQCLLMGEYECTPDPAYSCAFEMVDFSVSTLIFEDLGGGQISVTASPGPLPALLGSIDCGTLTFTAIGTVGGTCLETYTLTGEILSATEWSGSFTAAFTGSCLDCTLQSWSLEATASFCLQMGEYESSSAPAYSCAFGIVDFSASTWIFVDLGGDQISVTASPGPLPVLLCSIDCGTLTFTAIGTVGGTCLETYTLTGEVLSATEWSGSFTAAFAGDCLDCTLQSWPVEAFGDTAIPEADRPVTWSTIKALYRGM